MNTLIRIKNGWLLQGMIDEYLSQIPDHKYGPLQDTSQFKKLVENRQKVWSDSEEKIVNGMKKFTGLDFKANIINVYIVQGFWRAISDPLVVSGRYEGNVFVDVLTHEILHELITDNSADINGAFWARDRFTDVHDKKATNHIMIHAVHEAIYRETLGDAKRLEADIAKCDRFPSYKLAWDIVKKHGYKKLIADFRNRSDLGCADPTH